MSGERYFKTCREAGAILKHGLRHRLGKILNVNRLKAAEYIGRPLNRALSSWASARHTHRSPSHKKTRGLLKRTGPSPKKHTGRLNARIAQARARFDLKILSLKFHSDFRIYRSLKFYRNFKSHREPRRSKRQLLKFAAVFKRLVAAAQNPG